MPAKQMKFEMLTLPYEYDELEPYIDAETVRIHYEKHYRNYVDTLNRLLEPYPQLTAWSLPKLLLNCGRVPAKIRTAVKNNAGGAYNHGLYFTRMQPARGQKPQGMLHQALCRDFGSVEEALERLKAAAQNQFGSGYGWLAASGNGRLQIVSTANQDTPLDRRLSPLLPVDVWEHAYYLKYQNRRAEYLDDWVNLINWDAVGSRYDAMLSQTMR